LAEKNSLQVKHTLKKPILNNKLLQVSRQVTHWVVLGFASTCRIKRKAGSVCMYIHYQCLVSVYWWCHNKDEYCRTPSTSRLGTGTTSSVWVYTYTCVSIKQLSKSLLGSN